MDLDISPSGARCKDAAAADRVEWRKLRGQMPPRPRQKSTAYDEQVREIVYGPPLPNAPASLAVPATPAAPGCPRPYYPRRFRRCPSDSSRCSSCGSGSDSSRC